jgi:membrane protein YqaA with SNARE-associated domain
MDAPAPRQAPQLANAGTAARPPHWLKRLYLWVLHWAETPYGTPALLGISFAESSFFPIPPDVLQIALSVSRPKRSFFYAAVNAIGSVLGGIVGWLIGWALWSSVDEFFFRAVPGFTHENFAFVQAKYAQNAFVAIFAAAFTPIPFKVFTIAAGVFQIPLGVLIVASALGRSARFFAVATLIFVFGPSVKNLIDKYFELATCLFLALLIGGFLVIKLFVGR